MTHHGNEKKFTEAQSRVIGKFCTRCRRHKSPEGGATLQAGSGQTRWVCAPCLGIIRAHKR